MIDHEERATVHLQRRSKTRAHFCAPDSAVNKFNFLARRIWMALDVITNHAMMEKKTRKMMTALPSGVACSQM